VPAVLDRRCVEEELARPCALGSSAKPKATLFLDICRILELKRPTAFLLENVRNLRRMTSAARSTSLSDHSRIWATALMSKFWTRSRGGRSTASASTLLASVSRLHSTSRSQGAAGPAPTLTSVLHPENGPRTPESPFTEGKPGASVSKVFPYEPPLGVSAAYRDKHVPQETDSASVWSTASPWRGRSLPVITRTARKYWSLEERTRTRGASRHASAPG